MASRIADLSGQAVNRRLPFQPPPAPLPDTPQESRLFHLSHIDFERLCDEFAERVPRRATAVRDIRQIVEEKLAQKV